MFVKSGKELSLCNVSWREKYPRENGFLRVNSSASLNNTTVSLTTKG